MDDLLISLRCQAGVHATCTSTLPCETCTQTTPCECWCHDEAAK